MSDNVYHDHLDICKQCSDNPFGLCPIGEIKIREAVKQLELKEFHPDSIKMEK